MASPQEISDQNLLKDENVNNDSVSENEQNSNSSFDITTPHESNAYPEERESKQSGSEEKKTNEKVDAEKETDHFDPKDAVRKDKPIEKKKTTVAMGDQSKEAVSMPSKTSSTLKDQLIERKKTTLAMEDQSKEAVSMPSKTSSTLKNQPIERKKTTVAMEDQSKEAVSMTTETSSTLKDQPIERKRATVAMEDQSKEVVSIPSETSSTPNDSHEDYEYIHEFEYTNSSSAHKDNLRRRLEINNKEKIRKVKEEKVNESNNESNRFPWNLWKYITTFLIFLSSICILLYRYLYSTFQPQQPSPMLPQYFEEIEKLKPNYGGQTNEFWNVIRSFPYFLLSDKNPEGPAVLLMVASAGSLGPALQLSKQIARTLNNLFGSHPKHLGLVDGTTLSAEFPNVQKMMIDEQIRNMVDDHGHRAVIVTNLEKIDPKAIMIFHAYCDNTEAVYKNIAIILLLELPPDVQAKNSGDVYTHLSHIWSLLGRSRTHALFSRMANNIAILKAN